MLFAGRMTPHKVEAPMKVDAGFGHMKNNYTELDEEIFIYVLLDEETNINNNELGFTELSYVAYTQDKRIDKNWRIDGDKIVIRKVPVGNLGSMLYLREIANG